jgi:hypothetical protein
MSEYTPPMSRLRDEYVQMRAEHYGFSDLYAEEWDRALAAHDAQVRREAKAVGVAAAVAALRSLARSYEGVDPSRLGVSYGDVLNDAARRIEREGGRS